MRLLKEVRENIFHPIKLFKTLTRERFVRYSIVGVTASLSDVVSFSILTLLLTTDYKVLLLISLAINYFIGFFLHKYYTFRNKSKKIFRQMLKYLSFFSSTIISSYILMFLLVDLLFLNKILSRVFTLALMWLINYFLHSKFTFSSS